MDWKLVRKAAYIFLGVCAGIAAMIMTEPWSFIVVVAAVIWWVIYDGLLLDRFDKKTKE